MKLRLPFYAMENEPKMREVDHAALVARLKPDKREPPQHNSSGTESPTAKEPPKDIPQDPRDDLNALANVARKPS
jgi:hypothetical protein